MTDPRDTTADWFADTSARAADSTPCSLRCRRRRRRRRTNASSASSASSARLPATAPITGVEPPPRGVATDDTSGLFSTTFAVSTGDSFPAASVA